MEAATALSKLVEASSQAPAQVAAAPAAGLQPAVAMAVGQEQQQQQSVISDDDESCKNKAAANNAAAANKREIFPQRLMSILNDASLTEIVTWLPNGKSFVVVRPDVFTDKVLPKYLPPVDARGSTKYPSFTRKLNRWGFRQVTRGPDTGAFHHPLFRRDEPELCLQLVCQRSRDRRSSGSAKANNKGSNKKAAPVANNSNNNISGGAVRPVLHLQSAAATVLAPASVSAVSLDSQGSSSFSTSSSISSGNSRSMHGQQSGVSGFLKMPMIAPAPGGPATAALNLATAPKAMIMAGGSMMSQDEVLIKQALKQSQEQERLRAAKAMLYHAYMQALGAPAGTSS